MRVLVDEQRHVRELAAGRSGGQHVGGQAVLGVLDQAVRRAPAGGQVRALGRSRHDLGLHQPRVDVSKGRF